jgi:two-component system chemotaxis response regulator CheB
MTVCNDGQGSHYLKMTNDPPENSCRPSVDVLFRSAGKAYPPKNILCVILTGMGSDGVKGVEALQNAGGGYCLAQSKKTCTVYGMSRSMIESGMNCEVLDLDEIGDRIIEIVYGKK